MSCFRSRLIAVLFAGFALTASAVEKTDVFTSGEDGYHSYRIPAVVRSDKGTLLAFCEGRKNSGSDSGDIDLLLKRSSDDGRSWSAATVIWDDAANTCGNPCAVVDRTTHAIVLLSTHNLGADKESAINARKSSGTRTVWLIRSMDDGLTWSAPAEITSSVKDPSWTWYATGPGVGIQLEAGPHADRLVIPCDHNYPDTNASTGSASSGRGSHAIYSDDHGQTWKLGGVIRPQLNECQVVELFDERGTLLMDMRSYAGHGCRAQAISSDGGQTWSEARDTRELVEPICQASILRVPSTNPHDGTLLFSNPADRKQRINLTVRASEDNARTWPRALQLHAGPAAYSCLVALDANTAGCLYENGEKRAYERITFARFALAEIKNQTTARGIHPTD